LEGLRYLSFSTKSVLNEHDISIISRLSFVFAIFILEKSDEKTQLIPVQKTNYEHLDGKISSLLKYQGKTNELFTKMMVNVALLSSNFSYSDSIQLLDPVAGKGTTLFEGLIYGHDVCGIELESKFVHETSVFFKKFLETERLKHTFDDRRIFGRKKSEAVNIREFSFAFSKEAFKSGEQVRNLGLINGNSKDAFQYFKKEMFHLIVGDLPYGIVHGNSGKKKANSLTRNPSELLTECLPGWKGILKKGGTMVLAWNAFLISRQKLVKIFRDHGLEVLSDAPFDQFDHMVDKSIKRDIIVAKKVD
jgi:hypothetical protein